jgi:X-Pro dipeptidyl-peptidase C-terminal non-catalytic domain
MARFRPRRPLTKPRIIMCTIPGNRLLRLGGRSVVTLCICRPDRETNFLWESRNDVLAYSTPALAEDVEVTGPVSLELFANSSAVDTDFTANLVDVHPDGFAQNLTEGIRKKKPELMKLDKCTNSTSIYGRPAMFSRRDTASGWRSAAATSRVLTEI